MFVAAIFMAVMLLGAPGRSEGPPAFLSKALGAADAEAPLVRHPEAGVELAIQDSSFRIRSSSATVTLATQGAGPGDWHRFEHGVSRPIAEWRRDDPRRRADTGAVPHDPRAAGRSGPGAGASTRPRSRASATTARVAFLDTKLHRLTDVSIDPVGDPRRRGQGRHARRPPLERRASQRRLVADASPRRLEAPPPLRHRPGRDAPQHTDRNRDGHHVGLGDEADRRADERPPRRARDGDRQRHGQPARRPDGRPSRPERPPTPATQASYYKIAGGSEPGFLLLHLDDQPVRRRHRDRLLRREVELSRSTSSAPSEHEQHDDGHGEHRHDDGERRHRPRLLRKREQLDVHARRAAGTSAPTSAPPGISGSTPTTIKTTAGRDRQRQRDVDGLRARVRAPGRFLRRRRRSDRDDERPGLASHRHDQPADLGRERRRLVRRPGAVPTLSGRRGLVDERRLRRHDLPVLRLLRHDDGHGRPLRLPRGRHGRRRATPATRRRSPTGGSTTPRRARRRPSRPRAGATTPPAGTRGAARTASAARTRDCRLGRPEGRDLDPAQHGQLLERGLVQLGAARSGTRRRSRPATGRTPSRRRTSPPTTPTPSACARRTTSASSRRRTAARSPTTRPLPTRRSRRTRPTRRRRRARASASRRPRAARRSSASSTAAATPPARARRATRARSPTGATRSSSARPMPPATRTALAGELHVDGRHGGAVLDDDLPELGRHLQHVRLERGLRDERLLRHVLRRDAPASRRWRSRSARARATTGAPARSARAARSGTRPPLRAATGRTPSPPRASRPTAPTRSACARPTTSNLVETPSSRSFTIDRVAPDTTIDSNPSNPSTSTSASFSFTLDRGRLDLRVPDRRRRLLVVHEPEELLDPLRGQPHLPRARHRRRRQHGRLRGQLHVDGRLRRAELDDDLPRLRGRLLNTPAGTRAAARSASAARTPTRPRASPPSRSRSARATGNYWNGSSLRQRRARSGTRPPSRPATGRTRSRRRASRPTATTRSACARPTTRRTSRRRRAGPSRTTRRTRARSSPSRPRAPATRTRPGTQAAARTASAARTPMRPPASRSVEISIRQGAGNYWNGSSFGSGERGLPDRVASQAATGRTPSPRRASRPTAQYTVHMRAKDNALNTETGPSRSFRSTTSTRARSSPSPPPAGATTPRAGTRAAGRTASAARTPTATSGVQSVEISIRQGAGNYWNGSSFGSGSEVFQTAIARRRQLVVRLPRLELPGRRLLHRPHPREGQCVEHRDGAEPQLHDRHDGAEHDHRLEPVRTRRTRRTRPSRSAPPRAPPPSSASSTAAASPPARPPRATPASPRAATPSRCAPPTRPGTRTPRPPSTRGRWTRSRRTRPSTRTRPTRRARPTRTSRSRSTEGASTFECEIDGGGFSSCSTPKSYAGLSEGSHTFKVRATDAAGNTDASPAQYTWTVDTIAPSSTTSFPSIGVAYNASGWNAGCGTIGLCGTYSDATSGVQKVEISIRRGTGNYWNGTSFGSASEVWNTTIPLRRLLVPRLRDDRLPGRRQLHGPRQGDRQRGQRRVGFEPLVRLRHGGTGLDDELPRLGRQLQHLGLERGLCHDRPLRHVLRRHVGRAEGRDLHPPGRRQLLERHVVRLAAREVWNLTTTRRRELGVRASPRRASPRTGATRSASRRPTTPATASRPRAARSRSTRRPRTRPSTRARTSSRTRRRPPSRSPRQRAPRPSSARSTAAASPPARLPRATPASPRAATPSRCAPPTRRGTPTPQPAQFTWTVDTVDPSAVFTFPAASGNYELNTWNAGCATAGFCGTYSDATSGVADRRDLHPPGHGQLLERHVVRERLRGLPLRDHRRRRLVVRLPGLELPRRRQLHRARPGDRQRHEHGDGPEPDVHLRHHAVPRRRSTRPRATRPRAAARPSPSPRTRAARPSSASSTAPASPPARARRATPASPTAATPSRCAPRTRPATPTRPPPSTRGRSTRRAPSSSTTFPASGRDLQRRRLERRLRAPSASAAPTPTRPRASQKVEISIRRGAGNYWNGSGFSSGSEVWNIAGLSGGNWSYAFATSDFPADGSYTIRVKATDNAGNGETPASRSFTYDTADPSALFSFPASGGDYTDAAWNAGCGTVGFCGTLLRPDFRRPGRRDLHPARNAATTGTAPPSEVPPRSSRRRRSRPATGRTRSRRRASRPTAPTPSTCARPTTRRTRSRARAGRSGSTTRTRARSSPSRPREAPTRTPAGTRAAARTASAARTPTRPPASRPWTSPIQRVGTGLYWNGSAFSSGSEDFQAASFSGGNWSYAFPASGFPADGSYTVHIRAHDNAGNTETGPSRSFTIDNVAPSTTVDSGPSDPSASADATFAFSATEGGSTFECELDGGGFSACSSPKSYTSLSDGSHTFEVRAVDVAGNTDATPAQSTWSIDTVAPNSTMTFPASGASYRTSTWNAGCAHRRPLRHLLRRDLRRPGRRDLHPAVGTGLYWNGTAFSSRLRGLPDGVALGRQLVVRVWRGELPGRRRLHGARQGDGQRGERRVRRPAGRSPSTPPTPTGSLTAPANGAVDLRLLRDGLLRLGRRAARASRSPPSSAGPRAAARGRRSTPTRPPPTRSPGTRQRSPTATTTCA